MNYCSACSVAHDARLTLPRSGNDDDAEDTICDADRLRPGWRVGSFRRKELGHYFCFVYLRTFATNWAREGGRCCAGRLLGRRDAVCVAIQTYLDRICQRDGGVRYATQHARLLPLQPSVVGCHSFTIPPFDATFHGEPPPSRRGARLDRFEPLPPQQKCSGGICRRVPVQRQPGSRKDARPGGR